MTDHPFKQGDYATAVVYTRGPGRRLVQLTHPDEHCTWTVCDGTGMKVAGSAMIGLRPVAIVETTVRGSLRPIQWWLRDSADKLRELGFPGRASILEKLVDQIDPPDPGPEEPTGWLARVEDTDGATWVRVYERGYRPWAKVENSAGNGRFIKTRMPELRRYADIDVAGIVAEGASQ